MAQIFHRSTNTLARLSIFGGLFIVVLFAYVAWQVNMSSYFTDTKLPLDQPVPFSHKHHTAQLGIDCRYCHTSVENSYFAGIPATHTCMSCHSQVWLNAPLLAPVRESYRTNHSIEWARVNALPGFVYFNHSIHIHKGVGCTTCHGQIGEMPITWKDQSLYMRWCINCHQHPERYVRPRSQVFEAVYNPPSDQIEMGRRLVKEYEIKDAAYLISCETCHR